VARLDGLDIAFGDGDSLRILAGLIELVDLRQKAGGVFGPRAEIRLGGPGREGTPSKSLSLGMATLGTIELGHVADHNANGGMLGPQRPFNNAQRPLIERLSLRQPALLSVKLG